MNDRAHPAILLIACILVLLYASCSTPVGRFFSKQYENVVSYFNTYYNAEVAFDDAMKDVQATQGRAKVNDVLEPVTLTPSANQKFTTVIEKCSKLLQYHPTCSYVDDALLMIGEAYYFQGDFLKAERKFRELLVTLPQSDLVPQARLWLGRTLFRLRHPDEAIAVLQTLAEETSRSDRSISGEAYFALGYISLDQGDSTGAVAAYEKGLSLSRDKVRNAAIAYQLGMIEEKLGNWPNAAAAFRRVLDYKPAMNLEFNARLHYAASLSRINEFKKAHSLLDGLIGDSNYRELIPQAELERANVLRRQGKFQDAIAEYTRIDTVYRGTETAALSYFELAKLYENNFGDYLHAYQAYDNSRNQSATAQTNPEAVKRADLLRKYLELRSRIDKVDSVIAVQDSLRSADARIDSVAIDSLQGVQRKGGKSEMGPDTTRQQAEAQHYDSLSTLAKLDTTLQRKPVLPTAAIDTASLSGHTSISRGQRRAEFLSLDSLHSIRAKAEYELGTLFYLDLGRRDSAERYFEVALQDGPKEEFAPGVLFILADLKYSSNRADSTVRDSLYDRILAEFPQSPYAAEVRRMRGLPAISVNMDSAEIEYTKGEDALFRNEVDSALQSFRIVERRFPNSSFAAKATYAIGWIYANVLNIPDSAIANYRRLAQLYPQSPYAAAVKPIIAEIDAKEKLKEPVKASSAPIKSVAPQGVPKPEEAAPPASRPKTEIDEQRLPVEHGRQRVPSDSLKTQTKRMLEEPAP
ncbi:MAG: tetratricopeptide repeat protein [Bacteroidota bacterium]